MSHLITKSVLDEIPQTALFQKVSDICATVTTVITKEELLERSLAQIVELFGAVRGSIFILKENGKDLLLEATLGMKTGEEKKMVKRLGQGIVGQVAKHKRPILVDDIANDDRFFNFKARGGYQTPSFICAPMIIKDKLIGVVNITDKDSGLHFNKNEMQLLDFLASQIALNYRRIHLYQKFKRSLKETKTLKDRLGQSNQETQHLKKQIIIQEKFATIGKLAGGIAHEFNNPLDGVMRYTNLCLEHMKEDEVARGYLLEIKHGLNRMANIVKNLLACSRHEFTGRQMVDFYAALEHALATKQMEIAHKNIIVERKIDENIPPIKDLGLEQILTNILYNAIDAIGESGRITIQAQYANNTLTMDITDTGRGITESDVQKIFEPFYTTKDIDKGCGLGLTIVGEIVKSYNGRINVESEPDKGTTFTVELPIG